MEIKKGGTNERGKERKKYERGREIVYDTEKERKKEETREEKIEQRET